MRRRRRSAFSGASLAAKSSLAGLRKMEGVAVGREAVAIPGLDELILAARSHPAPYGLVFPVPAGCMDCSIDLDFYKVLRLELMFMNCERKKEVGPVSRIGDFILLRSAAYNAKNHSKQTICNPVKGKKGSIYNRIRTEGSNASDRGYYSIST